MKRNADNIRQRPTIAGMKEKFTRLSKGNSAIVRAACDRWFMRRFGFIPDSEIPPSKDWRKTK